VPSVGPNRRKAEEAGDTTGARESAYPFTKERSPGSTALGLYLANAEIAQVGNVHVATAIHRHRSRKTEAGLAAGIVDVTVTRANEGAQFTRRGKFTNLVVVGIRNQQIASFIQAHPPRGVEAGVGAGSIQESGH